jgi:hypothetical protein
MTLNMFSAFSFVTQISEVTNFSVKKIIDKHQLSKYNVMMHGISRKQYNLKQGGMMMGKRSQDLRV